MIYTVARHLKIEREVIMKKTFATSFGKAMAFTAIALAVSAATAQNEERVKPLHADVKINKIVKVTGQLPAGYNPQFTFNVSVTENELPKPPEGCRWDKPTYQPAGGNTTATTGGAGQVTVTNYLVCPTPPPDKCDQARDINVDLTGISRWVRTNPSGPLYGWPTATYSGTPGANWVGVTPSISTASPTGDIRSEIPFCLCKGGEAKASVNTYRADNSARLTFDGVGTAVVAPQNSFNSGSGPGGNGTISTAAPGTHALVNVLRNDGGPAAWNMFGTLTVSKGYWGACEKPGM